MNLELSVSPGQPREIEVVIVIEVRILLLDLKDRFGKIGSESGRWYQNDEDRGLSPVDFRNDRVISLGLSADN